jgi:hypothetical protein
MNCPACGAARVGAFRYCLKCQYDFEEKAGPAIVADPQATTPGQGSPRVQPMPDGAGPQAVPATPAAPPAPSRPAGLPPAEAGPAPSSLEASPLVRPARTRAGDPQAGQSAQPPVGPASSRVVANPPAQPISAPQPAVASQPVQPSQTHAQVPTEARFELTARAPGISYKPGAGPPVRQTPGPGPIQPGAVTGLPPSPMSPTAVGAMLGIPAPDSEIPEPADSASPARQIFGLEPPDANRQHLIVIVAATLTIGVLAAVLVVLVLAGH